MGDLLARWVLRKVRWGGRWTKPWPGWFGDTLRSVYAPRIAEELNRPPVIWRMVHGGDDA